MDLTNEQEHALEEFSLEHDGEPVKVLPNPDGTVYIRCGADAKLVLPNGVTHVEWREQ